MNSFQLQIDDLTVEVTRKKIKNVHLRVYPPTGTVRMSMPARMRVSDARRFLLSREGWIRHHQQQIRQRPMAKEIDLVDGEEHFFRGHGYALRVVEKPTAPVVARVGGELLLQVRPGADKAKRMAVLDHWYRQQMQQSLAELVEPWQRRMGVAVTAMKVRKTKAGVAVSADSGAGVQQYLLRTKAPLEAAHLAPATFADRALVVLKAARRGRRRCGCRRRGRRRPARASRRSPPSPRATSTSAGRPRRASARAA